MKRVAIHQPNFFPWLGFFLKAAVVAEFVVMDDCQINEQGYTRRVLLDKERDLWLRAPVYRLSDKPIIAAARLRLDDGRARSMTREFDLALGHLPYVSEAHKFFQPYMAFARQSDSLISIHLRILKLFFKELELSPRLVLSSDSGPHPSGRDRIESILHSRQPCLYVSGAGGKKYLATPGASPFAAPYVAIDFMAYLKLAEMEHYSGESVLTTIAMHGLETIKSQLDHAARLLQVDLLRYPGVHVLP